MIDQRWPGRPGWPDLRLGVSREAAVRGTGSRTAWLDGGGQEATPVSMLGWERRFRSNLRAVGSRGGFTIWGPAHVFKRPLCHEGMFVDVRGVPQGPWLGLVWAGKARRASYMAAWPATGPGRGSSGRWGARGELPSYCVHALGPCCWLTTFMTRVAFVGGRGARLLLDRRRSRAWCRRSHAPPLRPVAPSRRTGSSRSKA